MLVEMQGHGDYRLLGRTIDDAAGEAFDKVARYLDLGYPGGPAIDRAATEGDPGAVNFPRAMMDDGLNFSFSGLKTSVVNFVRKHPEVSSVDIAASFQQSVSDVLVHKAMKAARDVGATGVVLGGGVAANTQLRSDLQAACAADGIGAFLPGRDVHRQCCDDCGCGLASAAGPWPKPPRYRSVSVDASRGSGDRRWLSESK